MSKPTFFKTDALIGTTSAPAGRQLVRRKPSPMALEQRFMFDGAAVGDVTHTLDDAAAAKSLFERAEATAPAALLTAEAQAQRLVTDFLAQANARDQLFALFNGSQTTPSAQWQASFDQLMASLTSGEGAVKVELRTNAELQGAKGAFSATGTLGQHTIYLNAEWLAGNPNAGIGAADSASITKVLVEELGHSLDASLNGAVDAAGDEGEIFSRIVVDGANPLSVSFLSTQNDHGQLTIDGQSVEVEFANFSFVNAYAMVYDLNNSGSVVGSTGETAAEKEQSTHNFNATGLGAASISDDTNSAQFSGNDVSAIGINIGGTTYYGWISRPIKSGGIVRGFYFWTDNDFNNQGSAAANFAAAQADGNQDGDGTAADNKGFLLVVDQSWFAGQISSTATTVSTAIDGTSLRTYSSVGSSSDRVDSALNALLAAQAVNAAPVAVNDTTTGAPDASTAGRPALESGTSTSGSIATINATGNVLTNDTDSNSDTLTVTQITSGSKGTTASVSGSTNVIGKYGTLTIGSNGAYTYAVDNSNATVDALLAGNVSEVFTYAVSDGKGGTATATLTVQINGSNDAPVAANDYNTAKEITTTANTGYTATGSVLTNDKDVDTGDTKTITGLATNGSVTLSTAVNTSGSSTLSFAGDNGFTSVSAGKALYVNIAGTYRAVYASDNTTQITVVSKSDPSGLNNWIIVLSGTPANYDTNGTAGGDAAITNVSSFFSTNSAVGFKSSTSATETTGSMKTATVASSASTGYSTLSGWSGVTGTVAVGMTVTGTGVPIGTKVSGITYTSGVLTSIKLDQELTSTAGGFFTFSGTGSAGVNLQGAHGILNLAANGTYTYTPTTDNPNLSSGESAVEVFDYTMQDAAGVASTAKLYITVYGSGSNDPVVVADTTTAYESGVGRSSSSPYSLTSDNIAFVGVTTAITVLSNDTPGAGGVVAAYTNADGTGITTPGVNLAGAYGTISITTAGVVTYTVDNANSTVNALLPGSTLTETFRYKVTNTATGVNWSTLTITIQGTNDAPVAVVDTAAVSEDNVLTAAGNVLTNDTDVDSDDTKSVSKAIAGAFTPATAVTAGTTSANGLSISGTYGTLVLGADGTYKYTLATSADATRYAALQTLTNGTVTNEVFTYEVKDTNGATSTTTLTIGVAGANELPVNQFNGTEISSTASTSVTTAMNTALIFTGANAKALSVADADNNLASITLNVDHGTLSFTSTPAAVTLSASSGSTITISTGTQAQLNAALALLQYTPTTGFTGTDFLTLSSVDSLGGRDSDGIAINIPTVFTGPTVLESNLSTGSNAVGTGEMASVTLTAPIGQSFGTVNQSGTDTYGSWTFTASTGVFQYTLTSAPSVSGAASTRSINLTTYDATGNAVTNTVTVTVTDDVPTANPDARSLTEGSAAAPAANITGNVFSSGVTGDVADIIGADSSSNPIVKVIAGSVTPTTAVAASSTSVSSGTVVTGSYGTLTIGANGSYIYDLDDANATVDGLNTGSSLSEVFTYQIADADGDVSNATLTITINGLSDTAGATPTVSVNSVTVNEASPFAVFTVSLSNASSGAISFTPTLVNGTATVGTDTGVGSALEYYNGSNWVSASSGITVAAGATSVLVRTTITNDSPAVYEGSEAFTLSTGTITGMVTNTGPATGTGTIVDDGTGNLYPDNTTGAIGSGTLDNDTPTLSVSSPTVTEGAFAVFTVSLDKTSTGAVSFTPSLSNGTATLGTDTSAASTLEVSTDGGSNWSTVSGAVTIAAGQSSVQLRIATTDDTVSEVSENFTLSTGAITGTVTNLGAASATASITDNDTAPSLSINDISVNEASGTATFTVTRSGATGATATVDYASSNGTATAGADYTATSGTLSFAIGETSKTFTVAIANDTVFEGSEAFNITLSNASGASISDNTGIGTIKDDGTGNSSFGGSGTGTDDDRALTVGSISVNEASPYAVFQVSGAANQLAALNFTAGTAMGGGTDYGSAVQVSTNGGATWTNYTSGNVALNGSGTLLVRTAIVNDSIADNGETFTLTATNIGGAGASGTGTIHDDGTGTIFKDDGTDDTSATRDDDRALTVNSISVSEASSYAVFTVSGQPGQPVSLVLESGTATVGVDTGTALEYFDGSAWAAYTPGSFVTMPGSGTALLVRVAVVNDSIFEGGESFRLKASNTAGASAAGTATLMDDGSSANIFKGNNQTGTPTLGEANDDRPQPVAPEAPAILPVVVAETPVAPVDRVADPLPAFNSATVVTESSALLVRVEPVQPVPIGDVLTRSSGFQVAVVEAATPSLTVFRGITDQFVDGNRASSFALPYDAFVHTKPEATITLVAKLANGDPLPAWIQFDARAGTFQINPPAGFHDELQIKVIARDAEGREAAAMFRFHVGEAKPLNSGRSGFSEQIRFAAKRSESWRDKVRSQETRSQDAKVAVVRPHVVVDRAGA